MPLDSRLLDIVARCEDFLEQGQTPDLSELCRGHPELRPQIERHLQALQVFPQLPGEASTLATPRTTDASRSVGASDLPSIAGYEVFEELGRGGMGVVYRARQTRLKRDVALKMMRAGLDAAPRELERFRIEAEAVARLQHPNIVQIHEIGEHDGQPFLSLEYVSGGTLSAKCAGQPQTAAFASQLVELLARAIEAAHQSGIVHRDLKPANVLLSADGSPKVSDFGLAKKVEDPGLTATGVVMGTPSYMAPEQAAGRSKAIGPGADVYGLGAILYELMTGRPPFQGESKAATVQLVLQEDPVPPRRLNPALPRDLETICLKCLEKDPARRYARAGDLADDVRRFQAGEPIGARPISAIGRAWRWCRRRPAAAALIAMPVVVLVTATIVLAVALYFINAERNQTTLAWKAEADARARETARAEAEDRQRRRAEAALDKAKAAVNTYLKEVAEDVELKYKNDLRPLRKRLLEAAVPFFEWFAHQAPNEAPVELERGQAYWRLGWIRAEMGEHQAAIAAYRKMQDAIAPLAVEFPKVADYLHELARAHNNLSLLLSDLRQLEQADQENRKGLALMQRLADEFPEVVEYQWKLARCHNNLCLNLLRAGAAADAENECRKALAILEQPRMPRTLLEVRVELGAAYNNLGSVLKQLEQQPAAVAAYRRAKATLDQAEGQPPDPPEIRQELARVLINLASNLDRQTDAKETELVAAAALQHYEKLCTDHPTVIAYRQELAQVHFNMCSLFLSLGKLKPAEASVSRSIELLANLVADFPYLPGLSEVQRAAYERRAYIRADAKRYGEAAVDWERLADIVGGRQQCVYRIRQAGTLILAGDHVRAVQVVDDMPKSAVRDKTILFQQACMFALASGVATTDTKLQDAYVARSIELLRRAAFKKHFGLAEIAQEPDLRDLRRRGEFQELLAELADAGNASGGNH